MWENISGIICRTSTDGYTEFLQGQIYDEMRVTNHIIKANPSIRCIHLPDKHSNVYYVYNKQSVYMTNISCQVFISPENKLIKLNVRNNIHICEEHDYCLPTVHNKFLAYVHRCTYNKYLNITAIRFEKLEYFVKGRFGVINGPILIHSGRQAAFVIDFGFMYIDNGEQIPLYSDIHDVVENVVYIGKVAAGGCEISGVVSFDKVEYDFDIYSYKHYVIGFGYKNILRQTVITNVKWAAALKTKPALRS